MEFFKALGFAILIVALTGGFVYWVYFFFKKVFPDLKYSFKYKILRKKYNENEVAQLMNYLMADLSSDQVLRFLLVNGIHRSRAKELKYIYNQMKIRQVKGGVKNGK